MKKSLMLVLSLLVSAFTYAQIGLEVQAGMNVATINSPFYTSRIGFHAGIRGEVPLTNNVYANGGLLLSLKGASLDLGELGSSKVNSYYLDIPIHIGYKHEIVDNISIFGEAGPYVAIGLFGKSSATAIDDYDDYGGYSYMHEDIETFDAFKRFDFGLGLRAGVELYKKYTISIGYDFGLANLYKSEFDDDSDIQLIDKVKNRNLSITLGYKF